MKKNYLTFKMTAICFLAALAPSKAQTVVTFSYTGTLQTFTVPPCVSTMTIEARGAEGGSLTANGNFLGGKGAVMTGVFNVTTGNVFNIIVGGRGNNEPSTSGGGGGSGVGIGSTPMIVAGGGAGVDFQDPSYAGMNAVVATSGNPGNNVGGAGGVNGGDGGDLVYTAQNISRGGRGWSFNNSGSFGNNGLSATLFTNGTWGIGGGGGSVGYAVCNCGGGGGGYSGGGAGQINTSGGGGGSYNSGTNQVNTPGINTGNGLITISYFSNGSGVLASLSNPLGICPGGAVTLSASNVITYTWSTTSNATSIVVSPSSTTSYTVQGTNSLGCISNAVLTVSVASIPNVSIASTNTSVCLGATATLTANGANTYTWDTGSSVITGSSIQVSPVSASIYTVTGESGAGCFNTSMYTLNVYPFLLSVTANTAICLGKPASLSANGAVSYIWSNGSPFANISVSPTVATVYTVTSVDVNNCTASQTIAVAVNPLPTVTASASKNQICKGSSVVLSGGGAANYAWSTGGAAESVTVTPAADITYNYTVTGTDANGCIKTATVSVKVVLCTGINEVEQSNAGIMVFPNPNNGLFTINMKSSSAIVNVYGPSGNLVKNHQVVSENTTLDLQKEAAGIYFIQVIENGKQVYSSRIIKQ